MLMDEFIHGVLEERMILYCDFPKTFGERTDWKDIRYLDERIWIL